MSTKLFVAGISYDATDQQLEEYFAQAGTVVSAKIIIDRNTGKSKGFGFVEMASEDEAAQAMEKLNNTEFVGRTIVVKEARPQEEGERRPFRPQGGGGRSFRGNDRRDDRRGGGNRW